MFNLYKQDGETLYGIKEFILDSAADLNKLPTNIKIGSSALIIPTGEVYMLNGSRKWVVVGGDAASGESGSDSSAIHEEFQEFMDSVDANENKIIDSVELYDF